MKVTRALYCQYLLGSQSKYNQSHLASHVVGLKHDDVYRYLSKYDKLTPSLVWERVKPMMTQSSKAYIIFNDTVLDKSHLFVIDGVRRQWSGNAKTVTKGIWCCQLPAL